VTSVYPQNRNTNSAWVRPFSKAFAAILSNAFGFSPARSRVRSRACFVMRIVSL